MGRTTDCKKGRKKKYGSYIGVGSTGPLMTTEESDANSNLFSSNITNSGENYPKNSNMSSNYKDFDLRKPE